MGLVGERKIPFSQIYRQKSPHFLSISMLVNAAVGGLSENNRSLVGYCALYSPRIGLPQVPHLLVLYSSTILLRKYLHPKQVAGCMLILTY